MKKIISLFFVFTFLMSSTAFASTNSLDELKKDNTVSVRSYSVSATEFFGEDWRMTRSTFVKDKRFPTLTPSQEQVKTIILYVVGKIPLVSDLATLNQIKEIKEAATTAGINGIYSKTYYLAKPVRSSDQGARVPVACNYKTVTIFYRSNSHRITNFLTSTEVNDFPSTCDWYRLPSPETDWLR